MNLDDLMKIVASSSAIRYRARLQPAGGSGDKVFPPTYDGAIYAEEQRIVDGTLVPCIHLDSVQSQANRMELALLAATRSGKIRLPIVQVDFSAKNPDLADVGVISSLEAPHRLADAILRDSERDGKRFRDLPEGKLLDTASIQNATGLFEISPTSLLFGIWDSTGPRGGLGVKFQRCIVSELVAINAVKGVKSASRIDPLGIVLNAGVMYQGITPGSWTLDAKDSTGKPLVKVGKDGKPSEINHGNVTPTVSEKSGGITFAYALQTVVISLPALRRLKFPVSTPSRSSPDIAGQTALAALGLCASLLSIAMGCDLRSRCLLVPESAGSWEIIHADGTIEPFDLSVDEACKLLNQASDAAIATGLKWRNTAFTLFPSDGLAQLVRRSRELAVQS